MALVDNINMLNQIQPKFWDTVKKIEENPTLSTVQLIDTRAKVPSLAVDRKGHSFYIHSKYDPIKEAERFVQSFNESDVKKHKHIFFYGIGLGYHIETFLKKFPEMNFTVYEPNPFIFYNFICSKPLKNLPLKHLKHIFVEQNPSDIKRFSNQFFASIRDEVLFVVLPSYERVFRQEYKLFTQHFIEAVKTKRSALHTNLGYQKRWIINSLLNLPEVIKTPNILDEAYKDKFKDKPCLLVAAGPSLEEEIENLQYIKENNLAYIFSVGSAINALLNNNIYPHAALAYDPSGRANLLVFEKLIEEKIDSIPFIFGSSVTHELLSKIPGPKLHMITSQDTIAPYILRKEYDKPIKRISDAPTIAVLTLNILLEFESSPIIFVGQNLAYRNNQHYARGISYKHRPAEITDQDRNNFIEVEDVDGGTISSKHGWVVAKKQMEMYIKQALSKNYKIKVINATKGGAKIEGTSFKELSKVIEENLTNPTIDPCWHEELIINNYDKEHAKEKINLLENYLNNLLKNIEDIYGILRHLYNLTQNSNFKELNRQFSKLDKANKKMEKNQVYKIIIKPMNRVQKEIMTRRLSEVRFEKDSISKTNTIIHEFGKYLTACQKDISIVSTALQQVKWRINCI